MKIIVIGPTHPYKGGISHFTTTLVKHLRKIHDVEFISWKRQYPAFLYPVELKDTKSKVQIKEKALFLLDFFNPITWIQTALRVKSFGADRLILTWVSPIQAPIYFVIGLFTKLLTQTKILYICHNVLPHESTILDMAFLRLAFSIGDIFIVHAQEDKNILEKFVKNKSVIKGFLPIFDMFPKSKSLNIEKFKKELGLTKKVLMFFGYIRQYKGLKYLIQAMPKILEKYNDVMLLVVGQFWSKDKQSYFDLVNRLGLQNKVVFISSK